MRRSRLVVLASIPFLVACPEPETEPWPPADPAEVDTPPLDPAPPPPAPLPTPIDSPPIDPPQTDPPQER